MPAMTEPLHHLTKPLKRAIAQGVADLFNDRSRGEKPVKRRMDGLFGPRSVAWRVHGDVGGMMIGGVAGLLLQMLHPAVLAGVWDHSRFRDDMHGRLRRTAKFIALTTYGGREEAEAAIARVRGIHGHVRGVLPSGQPYVANDPALLAWVHLTETTSFLDGYMRYAAPRMRLADQDAYFDEMAEVGIRMGADPVPRRRAEARRQLEAGRPSLLVDERTREVARLILRPTGSAVPEAFGTLAAEAAVDLLPDWARRMHGMGGPALGRPLVRAGALGMARTLRWAFS